MQLDNISDEVISAIKENDIDYLNSLTESGLHQTLIYCALSEELLEKKKFKLDNTNLKLLVEKSLSLKPTIMLSLDNDGNILIKKHDNVDFMTIYNNSHTLLKEYERARNYDAIKYELCKLYYMITLIDNNIIYSKSRFISKEKKEKAISNKSFIMNDFKTYLRFVLLHDNTFNFNEYFLKTQFGIDVYKIDNRLIKLIKKVIL